MAKIKKEDYGEGLDFVDLIDLEIKKDKVKSIKKDLEGLLDIYFKSNTKTMEQIVNEMINEHNVENFPVVLLENYVTCNDQNQKDENAELVILELIDINKRNEWINNFEKFPEIRRAKEINDLAYVDYIRGNDSNPYAEDSTSKEYDRANDELRRLQFNIENLPLKEEFKKHPEKQ